MKSEKSKVRGGRVSKLPDKDPYDIDAAVVDKKRKDVDSGNSTQNWLKLSDLMGDKKSRKLKLRILPRKGKGKFWKEFGYHYDLVDPETGNKTSRPCPKIAHGGECPICDALEKCRRSGQEEGTAIWKMRRCRAKSIVQCYVDGNSDTIYMFGFTDNQFRDILDLVQDPDLGNMSHPIKGYDVIVNLKKTPGKKYVDLTSITEGPSSKVSREVLDAMQDLDELLTCDVVGSALSKFIYPDVREFLNLEDTDDAEEAWDDDEGEDDAVPFESNGQEGGDGSLPKCYGAWEPQMACSRCAKEQPCLAYRDERIRDGRPALRVAWRHPVVKRSVRTSQRRKVPTSIEAEISDMLGRL